MQMFTGPACQEVSAVYLAMDAAYGLKKKNPPKLRELVSECLWVPFGPRVVIHQHGVVQGGLQKRGMESSLQSPVLAQAPTPALKACPTCPKSIPRSF